MRKPINSGLTLNYTAEEEHFFACAILQTNELRCVVEVGWTAAGICNQTLKQTMPLMALLEGQNDRDTEKSPTNEHHFCACMHNACTASLHITPLRVLPHPLKPD